jgi:hypothetical protein
MVTLVTFPPKHIITFTSTTRQIIKAKRAECVRTPEQTKAHLLNRLQREQQHLATVRTSPICQCVPKKGTHNLNMYVHMRAAHVGFSLAPMGMCSRRLHTLDPPVYLFAGARSSSTHISPATKCECVIATTR